MTAAATSSVYYVDKYWNDLPAVDRYLRRRATGDSSLWWMQYVKDCYATPPRKAALVVGCGNGWVERSLCDLGVAEHFDAFDGAPDLLKTANDLRENRPITYELVDFNTWVPTRRYDLIINVASLHHVRYLFRICHLLSRALEPKGLFVHWEYVGPSRNQYTPQHVALMRAINASMPPRFRTNKPVIDTVRQCIVADPTEAVHSVDIRRALDDFFDPIEQRILGGGIAYRLLWNNIEEFQKADEEAIATLDWLIRLDESMTDNSIVPAFFAFMIYGHRVRPPRLGAMFDRFVREVVREKFADLSDGLYSSDLLRLNRWTKQLYYRDETPAPRPK